VTVDGASVYEQYREALLNRGVCACEACMDRWFRYLASNPQLVRSLRHDR